MNENIPEAYKPLKRGGGYLTGLGPWYYRIDASKGGERGQMVLAIRVERIAAGTHGQLTFGWEDPPCR